MLGLRLALMAFLVIVVSGCGGDDVSDSIEDDAILVGIAEARPDWATALNSEASSDPCDWVGITCGDGTIIGIDLAENQLSGEIPTELANLTDLTSLNLSQNQLTGEIPPELGNLTNLQSLALYANQLTGEIPPELGNLTNLTDLFLGANELTGEIPLELANLTSLERFMISDTQLTGETPPELEGVTER